MPIVNGNVHLVSGSMESIYSSIGQNGKGGLEISSGNFYANGLLSVGRLQYGVRPSPSLFANYNFDEDASAHGMVNQTGGNVYTSDMRFASAEFYTTDFTTPDNLVIGTYNHSGGKFETHYVSSGLLFPRYYDEPDGNHFTQKVTFRAEWNISKNADVRITVADDGFSESDIYSGSVCLSEGKLKGGYDYFPYGAVYESEVNITGGKIKIDRHLSGFGDDVINVKGAKASIEVGHFNENIPSPYDEAGVIVTSTLKSNFYLSSEGVSSINATGFFLGDGDGGQDWVSGLADLGNDHLIGLYQGFVSLKEDRYDLIVADEFTENSVWEMNTNIFDNTPVGWSADTGTAQSDPLKQAAFIYIDQPTIEAMDSWIWSDETMHWVRGGVQEAGIVNVTGEVGGPGVLAYLADLNSEDPLPDGVAQLLVNYLNEVNDGLYFSVIDDTTVSLNGSVLNNTGDAYFTWDLRDFNSLYAEQLNGVGVGIIAFGTSIPEPATWGMLLLGCGAMLFRRKKKA